MNNKEKDELRAAMGTLPSFQPEKFTEFVKGCSQINVKLIGAPQNPYRQIFNAATATWGDDKYEDKWPKVSALNRANVIMAALSGQTLPQALEPITFQFRVTGISRSSFDQTARARIGSTFFSSGVRDNNKLDSRFIMPTELWEDEEIREDIIEYVKAGKDLYEKIINKGVGSWQSARCILTMGMQHPFEFSMSYLSLLGQCSRRLKFCEQEDTVGLFWSIKHLFDEQYPLLGAYLRPGCDNGGKCQYHKAYTLSEMFGCLFSSCGRNKDDFEQYATFNHACTDREKLMQQLGFYIPTSAETNPANYKCKSLDWLYLA